MKKEQVIVERTYNAPVGRVWRAITDASQMRQWFMPAIHSFRPEVGFETSFTHHAEGKDYPHIWKITEVIPEKKISYEWRFANFPGNSQVTFELTPDGNGTRITVTHIGLETFEGDKNPDVAAHRFEEGWTYFIGGALKEFVEKVPVS